jgi:hypothetical protein
MAGRPKFCSASAAFLPAMNEAAAVGVGERAFGAAANLLLPKFVDLFADAVMHRV